MDTLKFSNTDMMRPALLPTDLMIQTAVAAQPAALGIKFECDPVSNPDHGPEYVLIIKWAGGDGCFKVHPQRIHRVEDLGHLRAKMENPEGVVLVTRYLTENLGRKCLDLGIQFMDMAGNINLNAYGLRLFVVGNKLREQPGELGPLASFKAYNRKGLQVVFALLAGEGLAGATYRALGKAAGVATGTVGLVMNNLSESGFMATAPAGRVLLRPEMLMEGWLANFPHRLRPHLHPGRFRAVRPNSWETLDLTPYQAQWGGELAGDRLTQHLQPLTATIYTRENPAKLAAALHLRPDPHGNIEVLDQFWDFPNPEGYPRDVAPPLMVYADLVASGDPRNADIARMIHDRYLDPKRPTP
jgi:hypothetical protein